MAQAAGAAAQRQRLHAMDALRAAAMSLGVVLHAAVAYMSTGVPKLQWAVREPADGWGLDAVFWYLHGFRVPLFFLIAGFFAVMLRESRGVRGFLVHRTRRILVPLVVGCLTLLPLIFVIWALGWYVSGGGTIEEGLAGIKASGDEIKANPPGPAHMWFLQYLYIYCLVLWAAWTVGERWLGSKRSAEPRRIRALDRVLASAWRPILFALPTCAILYFAPGVVIDFSDTLLPPPDALLYYAVFFIAGMWMYRFRDGLDRFVRHSSVHLLLSLPVFACMCWLLRRHLAGESTAAVHLGLIATMGLFAWLSIFGYLGLALRLLNRPNPAVRWLSDAAYWVYLFHLPVVAATQVLVYRLALPAAAKFVLVLAVGCAATLITYRWWVRYTFIGTWLNGPRARPQRRIAAPLGAS